MLLELAIGDAYGAGFEFTKEEFVKEFNTVEKYYSHALDPISAGHYTDDTQMSLAIVEHILAKKDWTHQSLSESFLQTFKRDPRITYSKGFLSVLQQVTSAEELLQQLKPDSTRNGAAMRSVPIGLFPQIEDVLTKCRLQAQITHNTEEGIFGSLAVGLMSHYFYYNLGENTQLPQFLSKYLPEFNWTKKWTGRVLSQAKNTVHAAVTSLVATNNLKDLLQSAISYSGDTDTIATIALGCASLSKQYEKNLPQFLYDELENGSYGRDYLINLDQRLFKQ